jgi:hypothetical protein
MKVVSSTIHEIKRKTNFIDRFRIKINRVTILSFCAYVAYDPESDLYLGRKYEGKDRFFAWRPVSDVNNLHYYIHYDNYFTNATFENSQIYVKTHNNDKFLLFVPLKANCYLLKKRYILAPTLYVKGISELDFSKAFPYSEMEFRSNSYAENRHKKLQRLNNLQF